MILVNDEKIADDRIRTHEFDVDVIFDTVLTLENGKIIDRFDDVSEHFGRTHFGSFIIEYDVVDTVTNERWSVKDDFFAMFFAHANNVNLARRRAKVLNRDGYAVIDYESRTLQWKPLLPNGIVEFVETNLLRASLVRAHWRILLASDKSRLTHKFAINNAKATLKQSPSYYNRDPFANAKFQRIPSHSIDQ